MNAFQLTDLQRPRRYMVNDFEFKTDVVFDRATKRTWQRTGSSYALNWQQAHDYIASLNNSRFAGLTSWRLPTIDELLSLLNDPAAQQGCLFDSKRKWLWSCDLHGKKERWFINLDMGYAASQDMDCPNFVKAVSSEGA